MSERDEQQELSLKIAEKLPKLFGFFDLQEIIHLEQCREDMANKLSFAEAMPLGYDHARNECMRAKLRRIEAILVFFKALIETDRTIRENEPKVGIAERAFQHLYY